MRLEVFDDADSVARAAAATIAADARAAITARGRFALAVSGGHTPWIMLRALATEDIPWVDVHVCQIDERVAPDGHPDRNLTHLRESLLWKRLTCELQPRSTPWLSGRSQDRRL
jgi:6-phosphogluconolactonase